MAFFRCDSGGGTEILEDSVTYKDTAYITKTFTVASGRKLIGIKSFVTSGGIAASPWIKVISDTQFQCNVPHYNVDARTSADIVYLYTNS